LDRQHRAGPALLWDAFAALNQGYRRLPPHWQSSALVLVYISIQREADARTLLEEALTIYGDSAPANPRRH